MFSRLRTMELWGLPYPLIITFLVIRLIKRTDTCLSGFACKYKWAYMIAGDMCRKFICYIRFIEHRIICVGLSFSVVNLPVKASFRLANLNVNQMTCFFSVLLPFVPVLHLLLHFTINVSLHNFYSKILFHNCIYCFKFYRI